MSTILVDDREAALRVGYEATDWNQPISFENYTKSLDQWTIKAIVRDGECIGAWFKKNDEVHVSVLLKWRGIWLTKKLLQTILDGRKVTTQVSQGHDYMNGILFRLGFKQDRNGTLVKENSDGH
jgi:hypothetical protein